MSYRLETGEAVAEGIQRIVCEQIDKALVSLWEVDDPDEGVHDARKQFTKTRAVLRLVRDEIGEDTYETENVCFRDVGRRLATVRDSAVGIETLDVLKEQYNDQLHARTFRRLREALVKRHKRIVQEQLVEAKVCQSVAETIEQARARVVDWPIENDNFAACHDGLKRVYRRGRRRFADALDAPTMKNLHEWRKRVKYLWYQTRLLRNLWPRPMKKLAAEVHLLADYLGDDHDLAQLRTVVLEKPELAGDEAELQLLLGLIDQRRAVFQAAAWPLGNRIYHEKPDRFTDRMAAYWDAWARGKDQASREEATLVVVAAINR